jgi:shikimate kinase
MSQASSHAGENKYCLKKTVVLVGMMGSGKTAIGKALAAELNVPFLDSDAAIEEAAAISIAEIFERDGEPFFRKREAEVIERLLSGEPCILSTGGGAFLTDTVRDAIAAKGASVWLDVKLDILWERVRQKDTRPLLRTQNPRQTLSDIFDARVPVYALAGIHAKIADNASIEQTMKMVVQTLAQHPDILEKQA